jgi:hypothetical protein
MAITKTELKRHVQPGQNWIDYSVTFDSAYAGTLGEALSFGSNTNFPNRIDQIVVLQHPTGYRVQPVIRTAGAVTNNRLVVQGSASTTSGQNEIAFLKLTTALDIHTLHCKIRVFGA